MEPGPDGEGLRECVQGACPPTPAPDLKQQPCLHGLLAGDEVGLHEQDVLAQLLWGWRADGAEGSRPFALDPTTVRGTPPSLRAPAQGALDQL